MERCKEYDTKLGYGYHDYFAVENIKDAQFPDDILRVNLFVLAAKDAHVLLSPSDQQEKTTAVYEIGKLNMVSGHTFSAKLIEYARRAQLSGPAVTHSLKFDVNDKRSRCELFA